MDDPTPSTILCLASYEKGIDFLSAAKGLGCTVLLVTLPELETAVRPRDCIDEIYYMPDLADVPAVINGVSYLARARRIDRIVPLDEHDVLTAVALREHLQLQGMGLTATRMVRDKLAMCVRAERAGVLVPEFVGAFNNEDVVRYLERITGPWLIKPRAEVNDRDRQARGSAGDLGSPRRPRRWAFVPPHRAVRARRHLPRRLDRLGWSGGVRGDAPVRSTAARYLPRGRDRAHQHHSARYGRPVGAAGAQPARDRGAGFEWGITHMEFIRAHADGRVYFLEVAARVGGAYIHGMIEHATGINLWEEWARIEALPKGEGYALPPRRHDYAGMIISLARQAHPDTAQYQDPEIVWRMEQRHHAGLIVASPIAARLDLLLDSYTGRFAADYSASAPRTPTGRPVWRTNPRGIC